MNTQRPLNWGDLTQILALAIAAAFCISVIYDMGFLAALGMSLGDMPRSFEDQSVSALSWVPYVIPVIFLSIAIGHVVVPITVHEITAWEPAENVDVEELKARIAQLKKDRKKLEVLIFWSCTFGVAISSAGAWYLHKPVFLIIGAATIITPLMLLLATIWPRRFSHFRVLIFAICVTAGLAVFGMGGLAGRSAYERPIATITLREDTFTAGAIRNYQRGVLLRSGDDVAFAFWDEVQEIRRPLLPLKLEFCGAAFCQKTFVAYKYTA